jgi:D-tyrosyl-tRNA(Tyr) deacylase
MKVVLQRVRQAEVRVAARTVGRIGKGMVVFIGVAKEDTTQDAEYLIEKITQLRVFADEEGKMGLASFEAGAEFLVVSQFTLYGDCRKGRRPSFDQAAPPEKGEELYHYFVEGLRGRNVKVETGRFAAMMEVDLINDGPVTLILESKH